MIDLHMHTNNSDGADTTEELLKNAEKLQLKWYSVMGTVVKKEKI